VMNITTRTTIVSNVQLDDNIRVRLLEKEGFKSTPEACKCYHLTCTILWLLHSTIQEHCYWACYATV